MVAGLWASDWLARAVARDRRRAPLAAEAVAAPGAGLFGLYLAGFFVLRGGFGGTWGGYGAMQLDLLAPFDPPPWGAFLPDLPGPDHWETGHSYAGLGVLLALAVAALAFLRRPFPWLRERWPLLLGLLVMLAVAVSHRVSVGGRVVELATLPPRVQDAADALRASERFLWPFAYALLLAAVFAIIRGFGAARAGAILAVLVVVQAADMRPGFARLDRYFPAARPSRRCACRTRSGPRPRAATTACASRRPACRPSTGRRSRSMPRRSAWRRTRSTWRGSILRRSPR
jgi:hypothetical protein